MEAMMARNALVGPERLKRMEKRQSVVRWFTLYEPADRATRDEAPKISRPSTLYWSKIPRDLHFLSLAERHVALLALYHPRVFDFHEQHVLERFEAPHPLSTLEEARHMNLPALRGTVAVAEELGMLTKHPILLIADPNGEHEPYRAAFPYVGDFLLALRDENGPYCVNWSVKANRQDFFESASRTRKGSSFSSQLKLRHELERRYFADANIPTHFIASEDLDQQLLANLNILCARAQQPSRLNLAQEEHVISVLQKVVGTSTSPLALLDSLTNEVSCHRSEIVATLYRAIWNRRIRVDLFRPILVDKPLKPEHEDVLLMYAHLFSR
jgi:hypothetical protein